MIRALALFWLLLPAAALAGWSGGLRLTALGGIDSNPGRDFGPTQADGASTLLLDGTLRQTGRAGAVAARYSVGGRLFFARGDQDVLVQDGALSGRLFLGRSAALGLEAGIKDCLGGDRGYGDLFARAGLTLFATRPLHLEGWVGARRFLYQPDFAYSFGALTASAKGEYAFSRRHLGFVALTFSERRFQGPAEPGPSASSPGRREDSVPGAQVGYRFRGPFRLEVAYALEATRSNSYGESAIRNRLRAAAGVALPWRLMLLAQGTLQLTRYPDGVFLSPQIALLEDDENLNSLSVMLTRPVSEQVDLELRYGLYQTRLPQNGLGFLRQVFAVGVTARL